MSNLVANAIKWDSITKPMSKTIYLVAYHKNSKMHLSICTYKEGKFVPIQSIGDINGAIINQDQTQDIEDFLSISNLSNLIQ